jgi:hypothetical protein
MSGGYFDYKYCQMEYLADEMEQEIANDFGMKEKGDYQYDSLGECGEEREYMITYFKKSVKDLRKMAKKWRDIEWFLSGDYGYDTFKEEQKIKVKK